MKNLNQLNGQPTEQREDDPVQIWQTCVEMANNVSQRRDNMNNLFVTLNLALTAAIPILRDIKTLLLLSVGIIICVLWRISINNYKQLNAEKFRVIFRIEEDLTLHPFKEEWTLLKTNKNYKDGTSLESILPFLFITLYLLYIVLILME